MLDFLSDLYPWTKAFHVISVISWMAGLFYLPRLFVYHSMDDTKSDLSARFKVMERKLYKYIMMPAMISSWVFGLMVVLTPGIIDLESDIWFYIKLISVILMTLFHFKLGLFVTSFENDKSIKPERYFRLINEIPTILMVIIVIMAILRPF